jgi:5-methylcytosine-specific restriction endonuclease McrBC GTP-binding regulatory subunit McrB
MQKSNLCAIPLKKRKLKIKYKEAADNLKTIRGPYLNNALSIHTTNSPSGSCESVPLNPVIIQR